MKAGGQCSLLKKIVSETECYYCNHCNIRMEDCDKLTVLLKKSKNQIFDGGIKGRTRKETINKRVVYRDGEYQIEDVPVSPIVEDHPKNKELIDELIKKWDNLPSSPPAIDLGNCSSGKEIKDGPPRQGVKFNLEKTFGFINKMNSHIDFSKIRPCSGEIKQVWPMDKNGNEIKGKIVKEDGIMTKMLKEWEKKIKK